MSDIEKLKKLDAGAPDIVKTYHKSSYAAISPLRPELSQVGKTILITGASAGIGFAIARAYAEASASKVILTGRRKDVVQNSASKLSDEFKNTKFDARVCDVGNVAESAALWSDLRADGVFADVLVLSAAKFGGQESILDAGVANIWSEYENNVRSLLQFTEQFYKQESHKDRQKVRLCSNIPFFYMCHLPCYVTQWLTAKLSSISFMSLRPQSTVNPLQPHCQVTLSAKRLAISCCKR